MGAPTFPKKKFKKKTPAPFGTGGSESAQRFPGWSSKSRKSCCRTWQKKKLNV
jgi:hypothetical protein